VRHEVAGTTSQSRRFGAMRGQHHRIVAPTPAHLLEFRGMTQEMLRRAELLDAKHRGLFPPVRN